MNDNQTPNGSAPMSKALMPPYYVELDFLDQTLVDALLKYTISNEARFAPARLGPEGHVDLSFRRSAVLRDLGTFRQPIKQKIETLLPLLTQKLAPEPIPAAKFEMEIVANGDGAFLKSHSDTRPAIDASVKDVRVLSGVYYFCAQPKAFTGGALRLHAFTSGPGAAHTDIEPISNSFVVFPSFALHEVLPVSCPSGKFSDSRFSINCWVRKPIELP